MKMTPQERMLQKCVDGELSEAERSAFLQQLDETGKVETWRTLALSFIENQVFAKALTLDEPVPSSAVSPVKARPATSFWRRQMQPVTAVAASLLLGAMMGVGGHFWMQSQDSSGTAFIARSPSPSFTPLTSTQAVHRSGQNARALSSDVPSSVEPLSPRIVASSGPATPVMNVRLGSHGENSQPVSLPVFSPEQWHSIPNGGNLTNIPEDIQDLLEAEGYLLERERTWYRARLNDGREILVPAETVRVRPAVQ